MGNIQPQFTFPACLLQSQIDCCEFSVGAKALVGYYRKAPVGKVPRKPCCKDTVPYLLAFPITLRHIYLVPVTTDSQQGQVLLAFQ